jgi:hypothetical protein
MAFTIMAPAPTASNPSVDGSGTGIDCLSDVAHPGGPPPWPSAGGEPPRPRPPGCAWTAIVLAKTIKTQENTKANGRRHATALDGLIGLQQKQTLDRWGGRSQTDLAEVYALEARTGSTT